MMRKRIGAHTSRSMAALLSVILTGCKLLTGDYHADYRDPPENLHEVMAVWLEEMSATKPVTVEEAASVTARQSAVVRQPPASLELKLAEVRAAALANNLDLKLELVFPSIARETGTTWSGNMRIPRLDRRKSLSSFNSRKTMGSRVSWPACARKPLKCNPRQGTRISMDSTRRLSRR